MGPFKPEGSLFTYGIIIIPSANTPLQVTAVEPNVHERQTHKDYETIIVQDIEKTYIFSL